MANKPLKSLKFPGLNDTYTVPQVDNTLETAGKAADAKKTGDEISSLKSALLSNKIIIPNYGADTTWTAEKYIGASTGEIFTGNENQKASDYIDITGLTAIVYMRIQTSGSSAPVNGVAFYDSTKTYISGIKSNYGAESLTQELYITKVPENAKYIRATYWTDAVEGVVPFVLYNYAEYLNSYSLFRNNTEELISYKSEKVFGLGTTRLGIINSSGKISASSGSGTLEIQNSNYHLLVFEGNTENSYVSFLTSSCIDVASGSYVTLCDGTEPRYMIPSDTYSAFLVPSDCNYIAFMSVYTNTNRLPVKAYMFTDESGIVPVIQSLIDMNNGNLALSHSKDVVTACIIGASIEAGTTHETASSGAVVTPSKAYLTVALQNNGATVTNLSHGGMGYLRTASDGTVYKNILDNTDFSAYDSCYICVGSNDWNYDKALGSTSDDAGNTSVCAMVKYTIETIYASNPKIKLFIKTPGIRGTKGDVSTMYGWNQNNEATTPYSLKDLHDAIHTICDSYGVEVIGEPYSGIVNVYNMFDVYPDGSHPTQAAMAEMAKNMTGRITFK